MASRPDLSSWTVAVKSWRGWYWVEALVGVLGHGNTAFGYLKQNLDRLLLTRDIGEHHTTAWI